MKVRVIVSLEIDAEAWSDEFGVDRGDVRDDCADVFRQRMRSAA